MYKIIGRDKIGITIAYKSDDPYKIKVSICPRCREHSPGYRGSWFTDEMLCVKCAETEKKHPDFESAKEAVLEQEKLGNRDFKGIGLPEAYYEWLKKQM